MANKGTSQQASAPYNRRVVLDLIRREGAISRKEIVERVSLSPQTVANITQSLEDLGLIISTRRKVEKSRGQPPIAFALNPVGGAAIGISLEPGLASGALVNLVGDVLARLDVVVDTNDPQASLETMLDIVSKLKQSILKMDSLKQNAKAPNRIWGIGVSLPGPFDSKELSFVGPTTLEGWRDLSILDELQRSCGLPVFYSVDSVAGALGESLFGAAKNLDCFYYLHFAGGLGGTLVNNQVAYKGANSNATEVGHIPVVAGGKRCYCGNEGCLERYLSLQSLKEYLLEKQIAVKSKADLEVLVNNQNPVVIEWCERAAVYLRQVICILENTLDPQQIIIGGAAPKELVQTIVAAAKPWLHSVRGGSHNSSERVVLAFHQEQSSILGAALLPIYEMMSPRFDSQNHEPEKDEGVEDLLGLNTSAKVGRL